MLGLFLGVLCSLLLSPLAFAANRVALVIGNADYAEARLANPVKDARDISKKLGELGFQVQLVENMTHKQIGRTMAAFAKSLRPGDEVVVFYAGHGLQVKGVNYFPVVDADIQSEEDVPQNSLNLNALLETMEEARVGVKLLFLDACRNNPFARRFRGGERGLARIGAAPSGTLIHFATRPGGVADDGTKGGNGLYTGALLRHLDAPGVSVETMVKRVAATVEQASNGKQEPWGEGSIKGEFYFRGGAQAPASAALEAEQAAWQSAQRANTLAGFDAFLEEYPNGQFAKAARVARKALPAVSQPVSPPTPIPTLVLNQPSKNELVLNNLPTPTPTSVLSKPLQAGQVVKDCDTCPEMVVIPGGGFVMGDGKSSEKDDKPAHRVSISGFLLGKFEVTQLQWRALMGNNPSWFKNCGDTCPVEQMNWNDVQAYLKKLSEKTGQPYRLPTEAEWEYAARAGSHAKWHFGDDEAQLGRYAWFGNDQGNADKKTHPVGEKLPNQFGLYDMHGNLPEWVQDCWHDHYKKAPNNGSAWLTGCSNASARVVRGGSWYSNPDGLRSAWRDRHDQAHPINNIGFRVARTLR